MKRRMNSFIDYTYLCMIQLVNFAGHGFIKHYKRQLKINYKGIKQMILIALILSCYGLYAQDTALSPTVVLPAINNDKLPYTHLQGVCTNGELFYYS